MLPFSDYVLLKAASFPISESLSGGDEGQVVPPKGPGMLSRLPLVHLGFQQEE